MKKYNVLFTALVCLITITVYAQKDASIPEGIAVGSGDNFVMTITTETTRAELDKMIVFLKSNNVEFEIKKIDIEDGRITGMSAFVKTAGSHCSFYSDSLRKKITISGCFSCDEDNLTVRIQ